MTTFDFGAFLRSDLPPAAARWSGFPPFNFVGGHNDAACVPVDELIACAADALRSEGRSLCTYGMDSGPLGHRGLREFIAAKLGRDAGIRCTADEVLITSGSLQGLDLVNEVLVGAGDTVIMEEMTYGGAITRLKRRGARIVGVPVDEDGLRADALEAALSSLAASGVRPKYVYTIPTVQNPTATVMSEARRREILALAARFDVPVFEDECYADLTWSGARPPAMRALDADGRVVHIGSFSKTIAPALRLGYLVADWPLMSRILGVKSDGGSGALEQMVLARFCREYFDSNLARLRGVLEGKARALAASLHRHFGDTVRFVDPPGGIFLWMRAAEPVDTTRLFDIASRAGIALNPGAEWMTDAEAGRRWMRLCFAHPSPEVMEAGVARLGEVCRREFGVPAVPASAHR